MADVRTEFIKAPLWQKVVLLSLTVFLLGYFLVQILFSTLWHQYRMIGKELALTKQRITAAELLIKDLPMLRQQEARALTRLRTALPGPSDTIRYVNTLAARNKLTVVTSRALAPITALYWSEHTVEMRLMGSLENCRRFLDQLKPHTFGSLLLHREQAETFILTGTFTFYTLNTTFRPVKASAATIPSTTSSLPVLRGFWRQNNTVKAFLNDTLVSTGGMYKGFRVFSVSPASNTVVIMNVKTNRKYTLKVLK